MLTGRTTSGDGSRSLASLGRDERFGERDNPEDYELGDSWLPCEFQSLRLGDFILEQLGLLDLVLLGNWDLREELHPCLLLRFLDPSRIRVFSNFFFVFEDNLPGGIGTPVLFSVPVSA